MTTSQFANMTSSSICFCYHVSLVKFRYWSKFHVNIITGSGVMAIFVYMELIKTVIAEAKKPLSQEL